MRRSLYAGALALALSGCIGSGGLIEAAIPPDAPKVTGFERASDLEHEQLVSGFGGEYRAPKMQALLTEVTGRLVPATDRPEETYRVTILDSAAINAFALPTGRLYVTRGLLALANDTSEIAAVLAHEIAHVTLRHAAARSELELRSDLVSRVVADVLKDPVAGAMVRDTGRVDIARFSRAQELEADQVSVRTLARAGFDPYGAGRFLTALDRSVTFQTKATGENVVADRLATHPATAQRIAEAKIAARRIGAPGLGGDERVRYLDALEGLTYGDNPADGIVRGRRFVHTRLGVAFEAPAGMKLENTSRAVLGATRDGERRLLFDAVEMEPGQSLRDVLASTWSEAIETGSIETVRVNGLPAAVGASQGEDWSFRMAAIQVGSGVYRLIMAARAPDAASERAFRETLASVRPAGDEAAAIPPLRVRLVTARAGDGVARLASLMGEVDLPVERFRILNSLDARDALVPGERYKIAAE